MKEKFLEYDVIQSKSRLHVDVPAKTIGTILMVFSLEGLAEYEVEFVDANGEALAVVTVSENDLEWVVV
ncbi:DUF4926 domain-containing protein [Iodobacter sp. CM08]|uniref:DUF4926 domain-containing protein n=1 Tax=Iodobacter sp. CM08 TaxID=3085902 RepID=UPI0029812864|nr:DUF4926 domain-containing protein [Iodobacter sp. CM08]MDW5415709.1 DUF4926 domain-containing protein [Iodobacter sp. CM08]